MKIQIRISERIETIFIINVLILFFLKVLKKTKIILSEINKSL